MPEAQMPRIISLTCGIAFLLWIGLTASSAASVPLKVMTTVAPITDMVKQIGKEIINLHGLVPEGVNSHLFSPTPGDVRYLAEADLMGIRLMRDSWNTTIVTQNDRQARPWRSRLQEREALKLQSVPPYVDTRFNHSQWSLLGDPDREAGASQQQTWCGHL